MKIIDFLYMMKTIHSPMTQAMITYDQDEAIETLQQKLLRSSKPTKVGFWGMGGIGKTVTGAAIVRDDGVRDHFDQIVWLPLGQTPVMEKLQSLASEQLTGKPMEPNLSDEEKRSALREAFKGKRVLLALGHAPRSQRSLVIRFLEAYPVIVQTMPDINDVVSGKAKIEEIRDVDIEDLLGRDEVSPDRSLLAECITKKVVMVTGAGGSIGSELCRQILRLKPAKLILFDLSEYALYEIEQELRRSINRKELSVELHALMGSIQNQHRLEMIMSSYSVETVYHAAAYKHVPLVEHNVVEGVRNNVFGTWYCAEAAIKAEVETFVLISTDKAVRPTNVMGATKRMAELVLQGLAQRQDKTRFCMVRFGNVLGSSGSVVPLFRKQIEEGGPVTVTHPDITRLFMTLPEAAFLVWQAGSKGEGGEVFLLDMGDSVKISDLAEKLIRLMGLEVKSDENPEGDIEDRYTGLRPGEKLYEELLVGNDPKATAHLRIMKGREISLVWDEVAVFLDEMNKHCSGFDCKALREVLLRAPLGLSLIHI